jgi:diguanylate cyclase (GGDEF)-like protein
MNFKSLRNQIIFVFLTLILGIQLIGLIPIEISINKNARKSVAQQLHVGETVFINILEQNTNSLRQGARILAADYGFRESIASNDNETIISALHNHQTRINADIAIFYSTRTHNTIVSGNVSEQDAITVSEKLIKEYAKDTKQLDFEIFNDQPYQLVAVPVKAPLIIGWVVMGFKIDNNLARKLNKLSNLQVTFIQKSPKNQWKSTATTMSLAHEDVLVNAISKNFNNKLNDLEISISDEVFDSRVLVMHQSDSVLLAVLQRSLSEVTSQYQSLKINLFILIILGLAIFTIVTIYIARYITSPIVSLSETAKQLELGNYEVEATTNRQDEIGRLSKAFSAMREAIALRERKVEQLAFWDEITGLPNRAAFTKHLIQAIDTHEKSNLPLTVIVLNLNRFKQINKILGRQFADQLLKQVGLNLQTSVRQSTDFVARLGADEFAILLTNTNLVTSLAVTNKLIRPFESALKINEQSIDVHAAMGIAAYPDHAKTYERLMINAETALQISKLKKLNSVVYDPSYDLDTENNLTLASELKAAIQNNQLALYLQPKVNIQNQNAYAAEALIRWAHPEKGLIFPDQFIPFAEQTGIIPKITLWMLNEACRVHAMLKQEQIELTIAVNIAIQDLIDQNLPDKITALFEQHQVTAEAISLEVTESSIMDDPERAEETLLQLSDMGIKIAIDDFGTGYSSLSYLKRLPVNKLKIDKSFVMNMENNDSDKSIVRSTIDLAHNLNLQVVAEGIENQAAWDLLEKMGCDYGQGYFMGKPMPVNQYAAWLKQWQSNIQTNKK